MCSLTLECLSDPNDEACFGVNLHCPIESGSLCSANCQAYRACEPMYIYAVDDYNGLNLQSDETFENTIYRCGFGEDQSDCDLLTGQSPVICNHTDCVIDCTAIDCDARVIDGSAAKSLHISCEGSTCDIATVYCPDTQNASCSVRCVEGTCRHANIIWSANADMNAFDLHCGADEGCYAVGVTLNVISLGSFAISCMASEACSEMDVSLSIESLPIMDVSCSGDGSCEQISLHPTTDESFAGVDTLRLHCVGEVCYMYACANF